MMPWKRPEPHEDFKTDAAAMLDGLRDDLARKGGTPDGKDFEGREIWNASWTRKKQARGLHKIALIGTTPWVAKCVWCEKQREWKRELDVEHYRPKAWVTEWTGTPPLVSDVPPREVDVGSGYWWLAFDWNNYALSCKPCNQGWKRNLFPLASPRVPCVEGAEAGEVPLLLDPASSFRPGDHFRWTGDGFMEHASPQGYATIITCGLNRRELQVCRAKVAVELHGVLDRYVDAWRRGEERRRAEAFARLAVLGARSSEFTSMVRWFVEQHFGCAWDEIEGFPA